MCRGCNLLHSYTWNKCRLFIDTWITFLKVRQSVNRLSDNLAIRKAVAYLEPRQLRYYVILNYIIIQTGVDWIFRQVNKQSTSSTTNPDGLINACLDILWRRCTASVRLQKAVYHRLTRYKPSWYPNKTSWPASSMLLLIHTMSVYAHKSCCFNVIRIFSLSD